MTTIGKTLKFRLYENRRNRHLHDTINCAGTAWNHITALQKLNHRLGRQYIGKYDMMKQMAKLRRRGGRYAYLAQIPSQALQEVCERHDKSYQAFFKWVKSGGVKRLPPRVKQVKKYRSITLKQAGWKLLGSNRIRMGKFNDKFSLSRLIEGAIKTVTIKRDRLGRLWLCFSVVQKARQVIASTGKIGGFDFGLRHFLTDHEGKCYANPQVFKQQAAAIAKANRTLAGKVKGSNGWKKAKRTLARVHERVAMQRRAFHWQLAHDLTDRYDVLRFEDLNLDGMKRLWGRKVSDLGFAQFLQIVAHLCAVKRKELQQINRWNPSSQCCSCCGHRHNRSLEDRTFACEKCGLVIDRDHNAALNIQAGGASPAGLGDVSQPLAAIPV